MLTVAATYIRCVPTTAAFFALIGLMSLTVFVAKLRRIEGPHPRLGFATLSVFVVLGADVLGQTIAAASSTGSDLIGEASCSRAAIARKPHPLFGAVAVGEDPVIDSGARQHRSIYFGDAP
jgi:hypothetical protein